MVVAMLGTGINTNITSLSGAVIVVTFCYLILYLFLIQFRREVLKVIRKKIGRASCRERV